MLNKKRVFILVFTLFIALSYSQNQWQDMMFDKTANFNAIVSDFENYKKQKILSDGTIPKGAGIKQFERWRYYWESRVNLDGTFQDEDHVLEEIKNYNLRTINVASRYIQGTGNWEIVGPVSLPNNGTGQLNGNGRLNCITFHPTDPNIVYVGAPSGGFWKTTDNGQTWTEYSFGLTRLGVSSIVVLPSNPDTIYIGTGDRDAGDSPGYGVWKSTDGGLTWNSHNNGMGNRTVYEILMDPSDSNTMIASTNGSRIYKTVDGGLNWTYSNVGSDTKDLAFHPTNSNIIYGTGTSVVRSSDGGSTWSTISSGLPTSGIQRIAVATTVNQPDWVYVLVGGGSGLIGIYRSTDSGLTYTLRTATPNILGYPTDGSDNRSQAWYDLVLAADPTDANTIYTGGVNLWKSTDGGLTMNCTSYWVGATGGIDGVHADQHALEFSPHSNNLYSGNDGGLYISNDEGLSWEDVSSGLAIAQVYKIGVSQTVSELVINGYQDNGTGISRGDQFTTEIGGDGMECIIDPTDETYIYGALYYGDIRRSSNGGSNFSGIKGNITEDGGWVTPYKLDPNNSNTMFAGFDNVWRNDAVRTGSLWTQISNFTSTSNIRDIAIAESNSNTMYISKYDNSFRKTTDALSANPTWTDLSAFLPVGNEPVDIEIDSTDENHLFIALNGKIYESTNGGTSWVDVSGTLPNISLNTIVIDKNSALGAMYVGMDVGVYYKDNTLTDWELYATNLPNIEITELEIQYQTENCKSKLYAATYAQGLWVSDLKDPGNTAPVACFDSDVKTGCVDSVIKFTDNSDYTPTSWMWSVTPATYAFVNGTSANSQNPEILFTADGTYEIALTTSNAIGNDTETKPSFITITNAFSAPLFSDDFETNALCATTTNCGVTVCNLDGKWHNLTNGSEDSIDWRVNTGPTPSSDTGPSQDFNPGTTAGKYLYLEASGSCTNNTAILQTDCINLDQDYTFSFAYHMYGNTVGSIHLDLFANNTWVEDIIPSISNESEDLWKTKTLDLASYTNATIKLRIRGITGNDWSSDLALDNMEFIPNSTLSIEDSDFNDLSISINSETKIVTITGVITSKSELKIYDLQGRLVNSKLLDGQLNVQSVSLAALSSGVYIANISNNLGLNTSKKLILR